MELNEEMICQALGVEPPEQEPAQEPEPQQEPGSAAEPEQEPDTEPDAALDAKPAPDAQAGTEPGREPEGKASQEPDAKPKAAGDVQKAIERAVQEAVQTEREHTRQALEGFFAQAGLKNTVTGADITTLEEFRKWRQDFEAEKLQRDLKAGKLTQEGLAQAIAQTPAVQKMELLARQNEEARKKREMQEAQARIDADMVKIRALDPSIREVRDLLTMPKAKEFYAYVKRGNSFLDAFYLANREELAHRQAAAAKQQAISNARSKEHLKSVKPQGSGAASIPADELALFREFNPGATEADIQNYYNQYKQK